MKRNDKNENENTSYIFTRETMGMTLLLFCAIVLVMLFTGDAVFAAVGKGICTFFYGTFGYGAYLIVAVFAYLGVWLAFEKKIKVPLRTALCVALTVFILFMLFHAVTTAAYDRNGYGAYLSACYRNAADGWSGYTFGGVISGLLVYPVMTLGGAVGAYVVFSILSLLFGYLTYLTIRRNRPQPAVKAVRTQSAATEYAPTPAPQPVAPVEPAQAPVPAPDYSQIPVQTTVVQQPVYPQQAYQQPVYQPVPESVPPVQEEDDKFSQKNLGRKILFENGEFAAESYRRNMIFNEDSYFNHPVRKESDYLSSFSSGKSAPKTYSSEYQDEVANQPAANLPSSYVYGEKPVENLGNFSEPLNDIYSAPAAPAVPEPPRTGLYSEPSNPAPEPVWEKDYEEIDEYAQSIRDDSYVEEEEPYIPPMEEPSAPAAPEPTRTEPLRSEPPMRAGFGEPFRAAEEPKAEERTDDYDEIIRRDEEKKDAAPSLRNLFGADSARNSRIEPDVSRLTGRDRSNANLLDDDGDEDDDVFSVPTERSDRMRPLGVNPDAVRRADPLTRREESTPVPAAPQPEPPKPVEEKPKHVWKKYVHPTLDLLKDYPEMGNVNTGEIENNKRTIVETLEQFKIACDISNVTIGPAITRYDVIIEDKLNIKRALSYREAISMALMKDNVNAYLNYTKGAMSIEVPNTSRTTVGLKGILASQKYINAKKNSLTFALGKNVEGEVVCPDITRMPHLLVAGTTGSGKSICLSSLLISLLYKYGPEELRLILVDPKQVEFISYDKLPHLMINEIIYDVDKALKALNWAIKEMERRYSLFKEMTEGGTATKNLDEYNSHLPEGEEKLPKIVIILDEFGDLMLQAKKEIEGKIIKLVQKARACGIHLILATQRPSVDCITGLIKSNLPTRIGFKVNSFDDSRTIFDIGGAEKLLGMGDMYFRSTENPDLARIQGCFVDTPEVQRVTDFIKANNETYFDQSVSDFINTVEQPEQSASVAEGGGEDGGDNKIDDTYIKALKYCVTSNQASVSMIQRRFPVGYIKACKIIDWMEDMNYITKSEGSKPRKVLFSKDEFINTYGDIDD